MSNLQRLHEIAHRWRGDLLAVDLANRRLLVEYVANGVTEEGQLIEHADHQIDLLRCVDCPRFNTTACKDCREVSARTDD
jgi:hypothetical protein